MDYRVLGSVAATDERGEVALGGPRQRRLLAALLLADGQPATADVLVEAVWGDGEPPDGAAKTLQSYVSRLRSALGNGSVASSDAGYAIELGGTSAVDAHRFEVLVDRARLEQPADALQTLDAALSLWQGRAYGDLADEHWCRAAATRLEELRLVAVELRCQALLDLGSHATAVADLEGLVVEHPLRERFRTQLMVALHRSGRQAEALRAAHDYRRYLADETGLEPSRELVALEQRIAQDDPSLAFTTAGRTARGYVLTEEIGRGAFGSVYRAVQPSVGREVAVKVVRPELADDPAYVRRFEGEARVVARLEHPHIVPLYDFWREPGAAYLVFRHLRGGSVEQARVAAGPWALDRVDRLVNEIGAALAVAHAADVVHRDVKPANLLFDDAGNAYLADFGIAMDAVRQGEGADRERSAGSPLYASPEQIRDGAASPRSDQYALAVVAWELLAGCAPWTGARVTEVLEAKLRGPLPPLADRRPDLPPDVGAVLERAAERHPGDRFPSIVDFLAAWRDAVARPSLAATSTADLDAARPPAGDSMPRATMASLGVALTNPYQGLRAFDEGDAARFHGRSGEVTALAALVGVHPLVAVVGPSGSGKSSLVRAGLTPALRSAGTLVSVVVPGARPADEIAEALLGVAVDVPPGLREHVTDPAALPRLVDDLLPEGTDLVLVLDQFEELWTLCDPETRDRLVDALVATATAPARRLKLVVTVRADFYDRPLAHPVVGPLVRDATFAVTPLGPGELEEAITAPAAWAGVRVEAALLAALVADVAAQPAGLPLLQHTLAELYDSRSGPTLTKAAYDGLGGVAGSVSRRADEIHDSLPAEQQPMVRRLFARLVTPGDGAQDTRRRARRRDLAGVHGAVVDAFGAARLLTFDVDPLDREPTVEVAHEALIQHWPRLRGWLEESREDLRRQRHLADAAEGWDARGRDAGELLRGGRLADAEAWTAAHVSELSPVEAAFVEESTRRARRARSVRRAAVGALGALTAVAVVAAGAAVVQGRRADDRAALARASAVEADASAAAAVLAAEQADLNATLADQRAGQAADREAEAVQARQDTALRKLASDAAAVAPSQPQLGMLLAVEAFRRNPGVESESALGTALLAQPTLRQWVPLGVAEAAFASEVVAGGGLVAAKLERRDGTTVVVLADSATLEPTGVQVEADDAIAVRLTDDGRQLVTLVDGAFQRWSTTTGEPNGAPVATPPGWNGVQQLEVLADGSVAHAAGTTLTVFPPDPSVPPRTVELSGIATALARDPEGARLAVAQIVAFGTDNDVSLVEAGDLSVREVLRGHPHGILGLSFAGKDRVLATDAPSAAATSVLEVRLDGAPPAAPASLPGVARGPIGRPDGSAVVTFVNGGFATVDPQLGVGPLEAVATSSFTWLPDGRLLAVSGAELVVVDPEEQTILGEEVVVGGRPLLGPFTTSADGRVLLVPAEGGYQRYVGEPLQPLGGPVRVDLPAAAGVGALSPDGSLVAVSGSAGTVVVDAATSRPLWAPVPFDTVAQPLFSPDGRSLLVNGSGGLVTVLDVATGETVWSRRYDSSVHFGIAWSADSRLVTLSDFSLRPFVVDAATGEIVRQQDVGLTLAFGPDGALALFGLDEYVRIEDPSTGTSRVLTGGAGLQGGGFTADGSRIVGLGRGGSIRVLDVASGDQIGGAIPIRQESSTGSTIQPLGTQVLDADPGAPIVAYELDAERRAELACTAVGRNLTREEWDRYLGTLGEYRATCPQHPPAPS